MSRKNQPNQDDAHANPTPSAPRQATAALATAAVHLRAHHGDPGRPGRLSHDPPAPTTTPHTRGRAAHLASHASTNRRIDNHHRRPGTDDRTSPIHHPSTGSHQQTPHHGPTGHRPSAGQGRRRDHRDSTLVL
jgi:hypothetical protein